MMCFPSLDAHGSDRTIKLQLKSNVVHPGGEAQQAHRDYHLGFMENADAERFPAHVHGLAAAMTLQGAVAHCDMPVESGPTEYLPHSHKYEHGYLAYRDDGFADYFKNNYVQLPLSKGDAVFFNPALLHAAGDNKSESIDRVGNLLQLSSAFGRSMETVDRARDVNLYIRNFLSTAARTISRASISKMSSWLQQRDTVFPRIWISINLSVD